MPTSNAERLWLGGGALGAVVIAALAWFLAVGPELSNASSLKDQTTAASDDNALLQQKISKLRAANANMSALTDQLRTARTALPIDSGLPDLTRRLSQNAAASGVTISSLIVGAAAEVTPGGGTSAAASAPAAAKPTAGGAAVANAAGKLFAVPVTVQSVGTLADQLKLIAAIQQQGARAALVTATTFAPSSDSGKGGGAAAGSTMTLQMKVFVAPQSAAAEAALQKQLSGVR